MSAEIIQIRDFQQKRDIERAYAELEKQAIEIANIAFPSVFDCSQANAFHAPEKDPA